jgi:hypothetical protein
MFRLDNILEQWATIYKPMSHDPSASAKPEDRAFFRIDRWELENEFSRTFNLRQKPCLCYTTTVDAQLAKNAPKAVDYAYGFYLCAKQRATANYMADDEGAALAKVDLNDMVIDLLAFLFTVRDGAGSKTLPKDAPECIKAIIGNLTDEDRSGLRGLRLEETAWWTTPRYKNGWWIMGVELSGLDPRRLCVVPERYKT